MLRRPVKYILFIAIFVLFRQAYALDVDKIKIYFLDGNYRAAIAEGEKALVGAKDSAQTDQIRYIIGVSYLKEARYSEAASILEQVAQGAKDAKLKEEAKFALGDVYLLSGQEAKARRCYEELLKNNPATKFKAEIDSRLAKISCKESVVPVSKALDYYTVQVGLFSSADNARGLLDKLINSGYPAYLEEAVFNGKQSYRVRVGKLNTLEECQALERKLSSEGYPTKICP